jgi:hypothetical protein
MILGDELVRENYGSIPATVIRKGQQPLNARTDPQIRLNWWYKPKKKK